MKLTRQSYNSWGIVSQLTADDGTVLAVTLEHAYLNLTNYVPKIPMGSFQCIRGWHQLAHMTQPFQTFEIQVPGHTNILFHVGNFNADSEGCVLMGEKLGNQMISGSKLTFDNFMTSLKGVNTFTLEVV